MEPEAAKAAEDMLLQQSDPAGLELHDCCKRHVGCEDSVVNHGGVVRDPDAAGPGHWPRAVILDDSAPCCDPADGNVLHQRPLPVAPTRSILHAWPLAAIMQ